MMRPASASQSSSTAAELRAAYALLLGIVLLVLLRLSPESSEEERHWTTACTCTKLHKMLDDPWEEQLHASAAPGGSLWAESHQTECICLIKCKRLMIRSSVLQRLQTATPTIAFIPPPALLNLAVCRPHQDSLQAWRPILPDTRQRCAKLQRFLI